MSTDDELLAQQWKCYPGISKHEVIPGTLVGARLAKYGVINVPDDLLLHPVGTVLKTGVSAYERIA